MNTKVTISRIDPSSTAKVISLTMGFLVAIAILLHIIAVAVGFRTAPVIPPRIIDGAGWLIAIVPFIYMLGSYIFAFVFSLAFNFAIRIFGGIRIELSD